MRQKKLKITLEDFILANRKAARMEEIERHGRQVQSRRMVHKSKIWAEKSIDICAVILRGGYGFSFRDSWMNIDQCSQGWQEVAFPQVGD